MGFWRILARKRSRYSRKTRRLTSWRYENFLGEPVKHVETPDKVASERGAVIVARAALNRMKRRRVRRSEPMDLAPWQMVSPAPVDVGYVLRTVGHNVGGRIIRIQVQLLTSRPDSDPTGSFLRTRVTLEKLPVEPTAPARQNRLSRSRGHSAGRAGLPTLRSPAGRSRTCLGEALPSPRVLVALAPPGLGSRVRLPCLRPALDGRAAGTLRHGLAAEDARDPNLLAYLEAGDQ